MKSAYLDDLSLAPRTPVVCKSDIAPDPMFTPGRTYIVKEQGTLIDDTGNQVIPSARFYVSPDLYEDQLMARREP